MKMNRIRSHRIERRVWKEVIGARCSGLFLLIFLFCSCR